ncbi:unnamed protein product [Effrenium voratum]|nr:unnamed protein product [Effrenium voratum]
MRLAGEPGERDVPAEDSHAAWANENVEIPHPPRAPRPRGTPTRSQFPDRLAIVGRSAGPRAPEQGRSQRFPVMPMFPKPQVKRKARTLDQLPKLGGLQPSCSFSRSCGSGRFDYTATEKVIRAEPVRISPGQTPPSYPLPRKLSWLPLIPSGTPAAPLSLP